MKMRTLEDLMLDQVRDLYDAEKRLTKALPKMAEAAEDPNLRTAFERHLEETKGQIGRIEQVFEKLGHAARGKKCAAMEGLVEEGTEIVELNAEPAVKDAGLIAAAQKVEHYEIATYGTVCSWAETLGMTDVQRLLAQNLEEERKADQLLTRLAESRINVHSADAR